MKKLFIYVFLVGVLVACDSKDASNKENQTQEQGIQTTTEVTNQLAEIPEEQQGVNGYYVGMFEAETYKPNKKPSFSNKITIVIEDIQDTDIQGHSVVAGNIRPFSGKVFVDGDRFYTVTAKEPGDDKYDGEFSFMIDVETKTIEGTWESNDKNLSVTKRKYTLDKKIFSYNKDIQLEESVVQEAFYDTYNDEDGTFEIPTEQAIIINASNTELKSEDLENLYKGDLEIIRNAIYARHGYTFKYRRMRYIFDKISWYIPLSTNVLNELTALEKKNIDLLKRYENHSQKYYDAYGR